MTQPRTFRCTFALFALALPLLSASAFAVGNKNSSPIVADPNVSEQDQGVPVTCSTSVTVTPTVRSESLAELIGDIVLTCTGGNVQSPGTAIPQANITLSLSTRFTSHLTAAPPREAVLVIDDPGAIRTSGGTQTRSVANGNAITYGLPFSNSFAFSGIKVESSSGAQGTPFPVDLNFSGVVGEEKIEFSPQSLHFYLPGQAGGGGQTTTVTITGDPNAQLQLLFKKGPKATATAIPPASEQPSQTTQFKIDSSVFGANPPDSLAPYYCEPNGPYVLIPPGPPPDNLPCPKDKLKPIGAYIPLGSSATISNAADGTFTVTITSAPGAVPATPAPAAPAASAPTPAPGPHFFHVEFGAELGAQVSSNVNNCSSLLGASSCHAGDTSFGGGVFGGVTFGKHLGAFGDFQYFTGINRNGVIGGANERSSAQLKSETVTARLMQPFGPVTIFLEGGGAFAQTHLRETETVGTTSTSPTTSFHINTASGEAGGGFEVRFSNHFGFGGRILYFQAQKGPLLDQHVVEGLANFNIRF